MRGDESRVVGAFCSYLLERGWQVNIEVEHVDVVAAAAISACSPR